MFARFRLTIFAIRIQIAIATADADSAYKASKQSQDFIFDTDASGSDRSRSTGLRPFVCEVTWVNSKSVAKEWYPRKRINFRTNWKLFLASPPFVRF